jgi:hypothetical protein
MTPVADRPDRLESHARSGPLPRRYESVPDPPIWVGYIARITSPSANPNNEKTSVMKRARRWLDGRLHPRCLQDHPAAWSGYSSDDRLAADGCDTALELGWEVAVGCAGQ